LSDDSGIAPVTTTLTAELNLSFVPTASLLTVNGPAQAVSNQTSLWKIDRF
jgi:hypothetical protein